MTAATPHSRLDWRNEKLGAISRIALWLLSEVGEGNTFTSNQLRAAIPVSQAARRLRDLRNYGWVIETSRTLAGLEASEMLLAQAGARVWEPGVRARQTRGGVTAQIRQEAFARDHFTCSLCGRTASEEPFDLPLEALQIAQITALTQGGSEELDNLMTVCANCHLALDRGSFKLADMESAWDLVRDLKPQEQAQLLAWIAMGRRPLTPAERAWQQYRRLPPKDRQRITERLGQAVIDQSQTEEP